MARFSILTKICGATCESEANRLCVHGHGGDESYRVQRSSVGPPSELGIRLAFVIFKKSIGICEEYRCDFAPLSRFSKPNIVFKSILKS